MVLIWCIGRRFLVYNGGELETESCNPASPMRSLTLDMETPTTGPTPLDSAVSSPFGRFETILYTRFSGTIPPRTK